MKLKKLVSIVSAVAVAAVCLAGCGSTASSSSQVNVSESVSASASESTESSDSGDVVNNDMSSYLIARVGDKDYPAPMGIGTAAKACEILNGTGTVVNLSFK